MTGKIDQVARKVSDLERKAAEMSKAMKDLESQLFAMAKIVDKVIDDRKDEAAEDLCKFIMRSMGGDQEH